MELKIAKLGIQQEEGWSYYVDDDGDVSRLAVDDDGEPDLASREKVADADIAREKGFSWFVDADGDIARQRLWRGKVFLDFGQPLEQQHDCTSYFERTENRYWLCRLADDDETLRLRLGPGRLAQWRWEGSTEFAPGDRVFLCNESGERLLGYGEIVLVFSDEEEGLVICNAACFSSFISGGPAAAELTDNPLVADPDADVVLTTEQGEAAVRALTRLAPAIEEQWADVFEASAKRSEPSPPLYANCMYDILHTDKLEEFAAAGGGEIEVKGNWSSASRFLDDANARGEGLLVLFDHAEWFVNPDYAALITSVDVTKVAKRKYKSRIKFEHFQKLPRKYLFTKIRRANGEPVSPNYQRGALPCLTPEHFLKVGLGTGGEKEAVPAAPETPVKKPAGGAGFGSADRNKLVEQAAVGVVTSLYERRGWSVKSVELDRCGYDLHCTKQGSEEHVEVKGVSGADVAFNITAGEVRRAEEDECFILYVVTEALSEKPKIRRWRGPDFTDEFKLDPIQYRATLRG